MTNIWLSLAQFCRNKHIFCNKTFACHDKKLFGDAGIIPYYSLFGDAGIVLCQSLFGDAGLFHIRACLVIAGIIPCQSLSHDAGIVPCQSLSGDAGSGFFEAVWVRHSKYPLLLFHVRACLVIAGRGFCKAFEKLPCLPDESFSAFHPPVQTLSAGCFRGAPAAARVTRRTARRSHL